MLRSLLPLVVAVSCAFPLAARAAPSGDDFAAQAALLYRIGACGSDTALAEGLPKRAIDRHCAAMRRRYASYRRAWADRARAFIAALRPADLPKTAVYPFGGGDLSSALVVFPDSTEITTLSLEAAGDIRGLASVDPRKLGEDLTAIGHDIGRLYQAAHSTTKSLQTASHSVVPGTIMFALAAMAVNDLEPQSLRYFDIEADGSLRYLTSAELDARVQEALAAAPRPRAARRKPGKGTVYRAWRLQESVFANIEIPDASGIPPRHAAAAGLEQITYGTFVDAYFIKDPNDIRSEMRKLWEKNPRHELPFRFGYPDAEEHNHLMVTRRP